MTDAGDFIDVMLILANCNIILSLLSLSLISLDDDVIPGGNSNDCSVSNGN